MQMASLWIQPIKRAIAFLETAIRLGVESSDVVFACYSFEHVVTDRLAQGDHLDRVWLESVKGLDLVHETKFPHGARALMAPHTFLPLIRGPAPLFSPGWSVKL